MKKVFSSHASLSHAWANQTHEIGKASAMFFDGPVIYSWGYHYEIALTIGCHVINWPIINQFFNK